MTKFAGGIFFDQNLRAHENRVKNNTITGGQQAIAIYDSDGIYIAENVLNDNVQTGIYITHANNIFVYLNNIYSNALYNILSFEPIELSYQETGNYWGHSNPPCFIPGTDSNAIDVVDSHSYCNFLDKDSIRIKFPEWGWNLFGFNNMQADTGTEVVLNPIDGYYELVQAYWNGQPYQYDPSLPDFLNTLQDMYPWYGYWIKITNTPPNDLFIQGDPISGCHPLNLQSGVTPKHWIGYWLDRPEKTEEALTSISGNYEYVRSYKDGEWKTYLGGLPQFSDLKEFEPGMAYIIKMTGQDSLDYVCG